MKRLWILLWYLIPNLGWALTLSDIQADVRRHVNDIADPKVRYTNNYVNDIANEIQREVVNQTWCLQTSHVVTLVSGTTYYDLPSNLIAIIQVDFRDSSGRVAELKETSERSLKQENPDFERQGGKPSEYLVRYSTAQGVSMQIGFTPTPNNAASTGTVRIQYYNQATDMSAAASIPFDSYQFLYPYHYVITYGVVARIKAIEGDSAGATYYQQLYQNGLTIMNNRLGEMPNYVPGTGGTTK